MGPYYSNVGVAAGPVLYGTVPDVVGIFEAPGATTPVGAAFCFGANAARGAVWKLTVSGYDVPGRFVIVDREFKPAQ